MIKDCPLCKQRTKHDEVELRTDEEHSIEYDYGEYRQEIVTIDVIICTNCGLMRDIQHIK